MLSVHIGKEDKSELSTWSLNQKILISKICKSEIQKEIVNDWQTKQNCMKALHV